MKNIVVSFDKKFAHYALVLLQSLLYTNIGDIHLFCLCENDMTHKDKECFEEKTKSLKRDVNSSLDITFFSFEDMHYDFPPSEFPRSAYFRLFIPELLPQSIDRALYLDIDMVVLKDLTDLYNIDLHDVPFAVAIDRNEHDIKTFNRLHIRSAHYEQDGVSYFNSGMILYNLDYCRQQGYMELIKDYLLNMRKTGIEYRLPDQDVLNIIFVNNKKIVPLKYNLEVAFMMNGCLDVRDIYEQDICEALDDPSIIHFFSTYKPWHRVLPPVYANVWREFELMTDDRYFARYKRRDVKYLLVWYGKKVMRLPVSSFYDKYLERAKRTYDSLFHI